ncbi:MAG: DUF1127 domain-containing protein [Pseudomonadota bacterium]
MTAIRQTAAPFGAITVHRLVTAVTDLREALEARLSRRRTVTALSRLTDRQLEDIGLCRADVDRLAHRGY